MGRSSMTAKPCATLKDLRSTGYFYDELKKYSSSPEMDISTYCTDFAIPYLIRISESYDRLGQVDRSNILKLAVKHLSEIGDEDLIESVFGLKKVAVSELDKLGKAGLLEGLARHETLSNRRQLESAKSLIKLLVNIIKIFKLAEVTTKQRKSEGIGDPVGDAIMQNWKVQSCPESIGSLLSHTE
jgi:hypothetical protein